MAVSFISFSIPYFILVNVSSEGDDFSTFSVTLTRCSVIAFIQTNRLMAATSNLAIVSIASHSSKRCFTRVVAKAMMVSSFDIRCLSVNQKSLS